MKSPLGKAGEAAIKMDFTSIEQRVMAHLGRDCDLPSKTSELLDLHKMKAAVTFGCLYAEVTKEQRQEGKRRNFGNLYCTRPLPVITEEQFKLIYTAAELKQLAKDLGWSAASGVSLYDTLNQRFKLGVAPR